MAFGRKYWLVLALCLALQGSGRGPISSSYTPTTSTVAWRISWAMPS
ncbi:hypothetical protein [uncultured Megasphaera sp.]|nr:hypothetical protein [uncultured Megasphaera sp.]